MGFRYKTHTFLSVFIFCPHYYDRKRRCMSAKRRFSKTEVQRVWTGENGGFRKRLRHWHWHVPVKKKTDVFLSVFGDQVWTVENAAKTLVWTKKFLSVFKKQKTEVFENASTSFPGSLLFTPQEAREGRPWLGLVTCLPEKN